MFDWYGVGMATRKTVSSYTKEFHNRGVSKHTLGVGLFNWFPEIEWKEGHTTDTQREGQTSKKKSGF